MNSVRARLDALPMSQAQVIAVALTFILSALDGYDVLSVTFAAPALVTAWGISKAALGAVLSAGLAGMAIGSLLLAPLADVFGRKSMILASLLLMAGGMLICAYTGGLTELAAGRIVAGLGIGTCVAVINPIASEFANARRRALTVSIMAIGYPVGGVLGGLIAGLLLRHYDWRAVFVAGFSAAIILLPAVALLLPESPAFLLAAPRRDGLARLNAVLRRFGQPPLTTLPPQIAFPPRRGYAAVFAPAQIGATAWITTVNLLFVFAVYFVLSWLPQMVADAGFAPASASFVSAVSSCAGVVGGLLMGILAQHLGLRDVAGWVIVGMGVATVGFGLAPASLLLLTIAGGICGFFLFGGATGVYATLATTFDDEARASGSGFVIGVGRVGSAIAPSIAGALFASGLSRTATCFAFGCCAGASGLLLILGWRRFRSV